MRAEVSISTNWAGPVVHLSPHKTYLPVPPIGPYIEPPYPMWWPPGRAMGQNKFAATVMHQGNMIVLQGHDLGILEPQIGAPPGLYLNTVLSSRKVNFSASTVKMTGAPAAVAGLQNFAPMTVCADPIALPVGDCNNRSSTVFVGFTFADWHMGALAVALSTVVSALMSQAKFGAKSKWAEEILQALAAQAVGAAVSVVSGAVQVANTGQGTIGFTFGTPPQSVSAGINFDNYQPTSVAAGVGPAGVQVNKDGSHQWTGPTGSTDPTGGDPHTPPKAPSV